MSELESALGAVREKDNAAAEAKKEIARLQSELASTQGELKVTSIHFCTVSKLC